MSSRRASSQRTTSSRISDEQIAMLIARMQQAIPEITGTHTSNKVSATKVLEETCNYIKSLHRDISHLSERLSQVLATSELSSDEAAVIRSLLTRN